MTVTGVDDSVSNPGRTTVISHTPTSDDSAYNTLSLTPGITVTLVEDDAVTIDPTTLSVPENGTATYTVVLESEPTADVTVVPTSSDSGKATVSPAHLTFTPDQLRHLSDCDRQRRERHARQPRSHRDHHPHGRQDRRLRQRDCAQRRRHAGRRRQKSHERRRGGAGGGGGGGGSAPTDQHGNTPATATSVTVGQQYAGRDQRP